MILENFRISITNKNNRKLQVEIEHFFIKKYYQ